ncbi:RBBP9/YdeN family alpha/beta hydrolase [Tunicatimonas pelagia]|uniref:RBBP9/YdeN family alpha/beta hydrolase n=1 Tax=Tunicatimonas pelagia TaxID=931531 RepID=UPI0026655BB8|nr:alpha/beta fold hydrolase [Tunicatimonas pelagia]WKN43587.1 alpha/beta fold hydrolase [Tunicatimonas pelagia]
MFFTVPGLRNSDEAHWQTQWEKQLPNQFQRIQQEDWAHPDRETWVNQIEKTLQAYPSEEIVLIGHSVGCATIVHWWNTFQKPVRAAMLVAPSDVEREDYPAYITGFSPMPLVTLPFPTLVVASTDDHVVSLARASYFARCWGAKLHVVENGGHLEGKSGFGPWPKGWDLLHNFVSRIETIDYGN